MAGGEHCLWKEHLRAVRVSETKTLVSTTLYNTDGHWFSCVAQENKFAFVNRIPHLAYLMLAYLQFVTWLVYFSFRSFRTHLCPNGLISRGLIPARNHQVKAPHFLSPATRLRRRTVNEACGSCSEWSQQYVFTFMYFHKSSSWPLKVIFFTRNCVFSKKATCSLLLFLPPLFKVFFFGGGSTRCTWEFNMLSTRFMQEQVCILHWFCRIWQLLSLAHSTYPNKRQWRGEEWFNCYMHTFMYVQVVLVHVCRL